MSSATALATEARSQKLDFFFETEPLSAANIEDFSNDHFHYLNTPLNTVEKRGKPLVAMSEQNSDDESSPIQDTQNIIEFDLGYIAETKSILCKTITRNDIAYDSITPNDDPCTCCIPTNIKKIRISWKEDYELEECIAYNAHYERDPSTILASTRTRHPKKRKLDETDDEVIEVKTKKTSKRKYERKKKIDQSIEASCDVPVGGEEEVERQLIIDEDGDGDEKMLVIYEGEDEVNVVGVNTKKEKKKKKKSQVEIKQEFEEALLVHNDLIEKVNVEDEDGVNLDLLSKLVYNNSLTGSRKKEKKYTPKRIKKEVKKEFVIDHELIASIEEEELNACMESWREKEMKKEGSDEFLNMEQENGVDEVVNNEEMMAIGSGDWSDVPDLDNLTDNDFDMDIYSGMPVDKRRLEESNGEKKKEYSNRKRNGRNEASIKKKKNGKNMDSDVESATNQKEKYGRYTDEDVVMAEIEKKKVDAEEKANKMKIQREREKERRKEEMEKKKEEMDRKKEENRRKKIEAREKKEYEKHERSLLNRKPKSRAEAARRTKALLALEKEKEEDEDEEYIEPKKKRKYRKRTKPISFIRRKNDDDDYESGIGCGKYIENPCDVHISEYDEFMCTNEVLEEEEEQEETISAPFLWTCNRDQLSVGAEGPRNFDPDECMKRHMNEVEEFGEGLSREYREKIKKLDGMKLNLFADTTHRRYQPRVIHNIDLLSTVSTWPIDLLPRPDLPIPKFKYQIWNRDFKGLVRIRPSHVKKDRMSSNEIDLISGGAVNVTKNDLMKNLDDLIRSKRENKSWTPLPSVHNPFDVPEISTRKKMGDVKNLRSISYVDKADVINIPCENGNKKRKKTRKEVLIEISKKPRAIVEEGESIYKETQMYNGEDDEGYHYEWDEMGEIMENPMEDLSMHHDPFAIHSYQGMDYDGDVMQVNNGVISRDTYREEHHEETLIGGSYSFMAAHIDM